MNSVSRRRAKVAAGVSALIVISMGVLACATLPAPRYSKFTFPKGEAFVGDVKKPYQAMGLVRSKVEFSSLDPERDEQELCKNYYNSAVRDLIKHAQKAGGDAVIHVKSVVFLGDGRAETHSTPECSDDGQEGQILTQGIAVKWLPEPSPSMPVKAGS